MEIKSSKRKHFTQEKMQSIIHETMQSIIHENKTLGIPMTVLARKYGVHVIILHNWKRQMNHIKDKSPIDLEYILKLLSENEKLKAKIGDLSIKNYILKDGLEIVQKKKLY